MENPHSAPVFIHSQFRAGSTYIFSVFRQSEAGYWCYQEPLNEKLLYNATKPGGFLVGVEGAHKILRHPKLDKPHSYEFHVVSDEVINLFRNEFSYQQYFAKEKNQLEGLLTYFTALQNGAQGRPVFQCCRTAGRVAGLKSEFGGSHIFLWRNPWDQWWSYKRDAYFDSRNLFIADANPLPEFIRTLKKELNIPDFHQVNPEAKAEVKQAYFTNRRLDLSASYKVFYALWCHAMLEAQPLCDVSINIDRLSSSETYRNESVEKLKQLGVGGIDFAGCSVPMASYGESDGVFFSVVEESVHQLLLNHGYAVEQVDSLKRLGEERQQNLFDTSLPEHSAVRDAMRAREYLQETEAKLSEMQTMLFNTRAQAQNAEARAQRAEAKVR